MDPWVVIFEGKSSRNTAQSLLDLTMGPSAKVPGPVTFGGF
jgi:hypothetical protein